MNIRHINKMFDDEIQNRLENPEWSCQVVSWVYTRISRNRTERIINIASFSFPLLAAALLFLILAFGITKEEIENNEQQIVDISGMDSMLNDSDSHSLTYDLVNYYIDNSIQQK